MGIVHRDLKVWIIAFLNYNYSLKISFMVREILLQSLKFPILVSLDLCRANLQQLHVELQDMLLLKSLLEKVTDAKSTTGALE